MRRWPLWLALGLGAGGVAVLFFGQRPADLCEREAPEVLIALYPKLGELQERHREETDRLLAEHRAQDIMINLEVSSDKLSAEDALRLSLQQVNQVAGLRAQQSTEFAALCREFARGGAGNGDAEIGDRAVAPRPAAPAGGGG